MSPGRWLGVLVGLANADERLIIHRHLARRWLTGQTLPAGPVSLGETVQRLLGQLDAASVSALDQMHSDVLRASEIDPEDLLMIGINIIHLRDRNAVLRGPECSAILLAQIPGGEDVWSETIAAAHLHVLRRRAHMNRN